MAIRSLSSTLRILPWNTAWSRAREQRVTFTIAVQLGRRVARARAGQRGQAGGRRQERRGSLLMRGV